MVGLVAFQGWNLRQVLKHLRRVFQLANRCIQRPYLARTAGQLLHGHVESWNPPMFVTDHQLLQEDLGKAFGLLFEQLCEEVLVYDLITTLDRLPRQGACRWVAF